MTSFFKKHTLLFLCGALVVLTGCSSSEEAPKGPNISQAEPMSQAEKEAFMQDIRNATMTSAEESFEPKRFVEIIVDSSGSMGAEVEGETKIETAKTMLGLITQSLKQEKAAISLTAFGHRKAWSCKDIEHIFDTQVKDPDEVMASLNKIYPVQNGKTPLAASLKLAHERLKKNKGHKSIFVITDGMESCGGDPCKVAAELSKDLDVKIYTLTYKTANVEEFKQLSCLGDDIVDAKTPEDAFGQMAALKQAMDQDYSEAMSAFENIQSLRVFGPDPKAWAVAVDSQTGARFRFISSLGTSLPVGNYKVTVLYPSPYVFEDVAVAEKENKIIRVEGHGFLTIEEEYPGVILNATNALDSQSYRLLSGEPAEVPIGRYNIFAITTSGLAFQWQNKKVTPGAVTKLPLPNWALITVKSNSPMNYDVFPSSNTDLALSQNAEKLIEEQKEKGNVTGKIKISQYKNSIGFFPTNSPQIVEPGSYMLILSNGKKLEEVTIEKGDRIDLSLSDFE